MLMCAPVYVCVCVDVCTYMWCVYECVLMCVRINMVVIECNVGRWDMSCKEL